MGKVCQSCGKREAKIHFTEIRDGKKTELHICEQCAHQKNIALAFPAILGSLMKPEAGGGGPREAEAVPGACPSCGLTYADFKAKGRLGCARCYEVFAPVLVPLLEKVHGKSQHVGRVPERMRRELESRRKVKSLEDELKRAIEAEDYEKAARIRDRIREAREGERGR